LSKKPIKTAMISQTYVLKEIGPDDEVLFKLHNLVRNLDDQLRFETYYRGMRENKRSIIHEWSDAFLEGQTLRAVHDTEFNFWYFEVKFDDSKVDVKVLDEAVRRVLSVEDVDDLIHKAMLGTPSIKRDLVMAATANRDEPRINLISLIEQYLQKKEPKMKEAAMLATLILGSPQLLPAVHSALLSENDERVSMVLQYIESVLSHEPITLVKRNKP
jgi:hypothetical protein